jgi:thiamine pyrophosphate-dependent acetolactate synthase large subunit-like protein
MARTAADVLADRLIDWGVRVIFGLPGDGIMEAMMLAEAASHSRCSATRSAI